MAVGRSGYWGWVGSSYGEYLRAEITHHSIDIVNNRSRFNYRVWNDSNNSYGDIGRVSASIKTGSTTRASVSNKSISATTGYNQTREIMNGSFYISHNSDGSLGNQTFSVSATRTDGNVKSASLSLTVTNIPTIPRASKCLFPLHIMGDEFWVSVERASSSFTHTLTVYVNNVQILTRTGVGSGVSITPTANQKIAMHEATPNSRDAIMKIKCETFSGTTKIGESFFENHVWVDNEFVYPNSPDIEVDEVNPKVYDITYKLVYGYSNIKVIITKPATAKLGATMKYYEIKIGNQTKRVDYTTNLIEVTFNSVVGDEVEIIAWDSRGLGVSYSYGWGNYTIKDYKPPTFSTLEIERVDGVGTDVMLNAIINVWSGYWIDDADHLNTLSSFEYRTREKGGTWSNWFDKTAVIRSGMQQVNGKITISNLVIKRFGETGEYELGKEYDVELRIKDGTYIVSGYLTTPFQNIETTRRVTDGTVLEAFYKDEDGYHRGYGGMPNNDYNHTFYGDVNIAGALQINGISLIDLTYPVGAIYISVNNINPSTLFGGTWERFGQGKVLVGVNENDTDFNTVQKTGGAKTHTLTIDEMPSHRHALETGGRTLPWEAPNFVLSYQYQESAPVEGTGAMGYAGGGQAHNNLQPYITVYMWKRVA